jgi:hypothetical protein
VTKPFDEADYYTELTLASERAYVLFKTFGWTWNNGIAPVLVEIRATFCRLAREMDAQTIRVETGRLLVIREGSGYRFYVSVS